MKIKSPIGFLALWSAFLAVGTWVLPMGLPLLSFGEKAYASAPVGTASENPCRWERSGSGVAIGDRPDSRHAVKRCRGC